MKTVAIVGSQDRTRGLAPFDNPDIDIWVFNEAANQEWCKRADVVFQMHIAPIYRSANNRSDPDHWKWLQENHPGLTVYMLDTDPLVPCSARYPLEYVAGALLQDFRQGVELQRKQYFTSTVAYALALAVFQEYERILLYGVEMGSETEYVYQRPCVLFWVGVALGRGIKVDFVSGDDIFSDPLYGYEGVIADTPDEFEQRAEELRGHVSQLIDASAEAEKKLRVITPNGNLGAVLTEMIAVNGELGDAEGRLAENERYAHKVREMIKADGAAYIDRSEYEMQARINQPLADAHSADTLKASGAINYLMRAWVEGHNPTALEQIKTIAGRMCYSALNAGKAQGVVSENQLLMSRLDKRIQAAGGSKAAEYQRGEQWQEPRP